MNAATNTPAARFTFAPGTLVHVLGPWQMDLQGRGVDAWTGKTMEVIEHHASGNVDLAREGHDEAEVSIYEGRLVAD
jgi:hypothetical protein